jgi:tetratricopeptide (TPR) repeat protein
MGKVRGRRRLWAAIATAAVLAVALAGAGLVRAWPALFPDALRAGYAAYDRGDWRSAEAAARRALDRRPDDVAALRLLARTAARQGRDDSAQAIYGRIGARQGAEALQAEDYVLVAAALARRGQGREAEAVLGLVRLDDQVRPELLSEMARILSANDKLAEAAAIAERLARRPGWEARGSAILGLLRSRQADPAGAAAMLQRALRLDPKLEGVPFPPAAVRKLLAGDLLRLGRPGEAREPLRAALAAGPDPEASWLLSRALLQQGDAAGAAAALKDARGFGEDDPTAPEPAPFVGAAGCAGCHKTIHRNQQSSRHARTFHVADALSAAIPVPEGPVVDPYNKKVVHTIRREPGGIGWETKVEGRAYRALVAYAFGSGDRGLTPVGRDESGTFREMRLSHYGDRQGWDLTTGLSPSPNDPHDYLGDPQSPDLVRRCIHCHTTDARAARDRIEPLASDHAIGCERCHGPGGNHLKAVELGLKLPDQSPDLAIARPKLASAAQVVALCAQCHSPRGREVHPSDFDAVRFQATTLTWSRCYTESGGGLSCITCHDPHRNAETSAAFYESKCLACHGSPPPEKSSGGETPHATTRRAPCPVNPANDCLKCHMPLNSTAVLHSTFSDHYIRVHKSADAGG